ncbi:hypothetical protein LXT12_26430 [Pelomonas sp. P7]|uniref:Uncharacterized protein n=1 Tax=Pelomonas caseinilytica TaxID=2906763 RepID=A0ABS8XQB6_9BURK|nr:hypothetical protein [Pelomonas sp. P7]MCE4540771.1 hypothetical protein [Pelomonas sp. P7]
MPTDIRVPIPQPGEYLRLYFDEMVENDGFDLALDYSVSEFDELARLTGLTVTDAPATDAGAAVHYTVSWEAFHACDGKAVGGDHSRVVRGRKDGADWVFDKAAAPTTRSTVDEF